MSRLCYFCRIFAALFAVFLWNAASLGATQVSDLVAEYDRQSAQLAADLNGAADQLESEAAGHDSDDHRAEGARLIASLTRGWRPAKPGSGSILFVANDIYDGQKAFAEILRYEKAFAKASTQHSNPVLSIHDIRRRYGDTLFGLAKDAAEAGQLSLAYQWATEAARENPDQAEARRVLGYEEHNGLWLTPFATRMVDAGKVWDPRYGWVAADDVARYEKGDRLVGKQWVTADVDAARRTRIEDGWQVRTDNFLVTSNLSLEAAAELAARLERLHQVWQQLFAGFWTSDLEVKQLFAGERLARERHQPFRVFLHRDRDDYNASLQKRQPRIGETLGIYFDANHEAHFFAGKDQDAGTLYHETVHELFQETRPAVKHIADRANYWIVEGIATYFETLSEHRDAKAGLYYTIGQASAGRLPAARKRLLADGYYIPLEPLTKWGKSELQQQPELAKIYSEASGLSAFLMDAQNAKYREPLVRYLQAIYAGHDDSQTLSRHTGRSLAELDAEYRQFMESLP